MKCRECGRDMRLDDVNRKFKGNKGNYYVCEHCKLNASNRVDTVKHGVSHGTVKMMVL